MSEVARSRRDDPRSEPQLSIPGRDAPSPAASDPLAELARLVGQDDPYRNVFRPVPAQDPFRAGAVPSGRARDGSDLGEPPPVPAPQGHIGHHDDVAERDHEPDGAREAEAFHGEGDVSGFHDPAHDPYGADEERYAAAERAAYADEAGLADGHPAPDGLSADALPDHWARGGDAVEGAPPAIDGDVTTARLAGGSSSARRPVMVLAAVLLLTGGGLAASFMMKGGSSANVGVAAAGRPAPTILAAAGPTKVKVDDGSATAPEDQDAALLSKNGSVSSGPVKIVSSQEQPADLGQLPKSDLAEGARPLPPPSPSPFPEPKKVKTFVIHPDGTMLSGEPAPGTAPSPAGSAPAGGAGAALDAAHREQPLDLLLGHGQLPERDVERLVPRPGRRALGVELDAHPRPGEGVPQLVGQARRELGEQPGPLGFADRPPHLAELRRHSVDRIGEVADLVVRRPGVELVEVAGGDPRHLAPDPADSPADPVGDPARDGRHQDQRAQPHGQGGGRGLPSGLPPARLGVEHQERRATRPARGPQRGDQVAGAVEQERRRAGQGIEPGHGRADPGDGGRSGGAGRGGVGDAAVLAVGGEVGPGQAPHRGKDAPGVREVRVPERLDDLVHAADDLPLAPPGGEMGGGHREGRDGHALDGDERDQDLIADRAEHREASSEGGSDVGLLDQPSEPAGPVARKGVIVGRPSPDRPAKTPRRNSRRPRPKNRRPPPGGDGFICDNNLPCRDLWHR